MSRALDFLGAALAFAFAGSCLIGALLYVLAWQPWVAALLGATIALIVCTRRRS